MGHRYIGSKTKILDQIVSAIKQIAPSGGRIIDLMSGTAIVSVALRKAGFKVTAVDVMTHAFHHARVGLLLREVPSFKNAKAFIKKYSTSNGESTYAQIIKGLNLLSPVKGYFFNEFSVGGTPSDATKPRNYFSPRNAQKIDSIRHCIKEMYEERAINEIEHSLLLHDLIMAVNDIANISGTYGYYLSRLTGRAKDDLELKPTVFDEVDNSKGHIILRGFAEELSASISGDLCYIDPPYIKRQYAANYHILETLAREDCPTAIGESGLRPWRDQYSNFCTKTKIRQAFRKIFLTIGCKDFLISYSEDGLLKIGELRKFLSEFGSIKLNSLKNKRFRSNKSDLGKQLTEYLIYLQIKQ